jgi:hypothetical protein
MKLGDALQNTADAERLGRNNVNAVIYLSMLASPRMNVEIATENGRQPAAIAGLLA